MTSKTFAGLLASAAWFTPAGVLAQSLPPTATTTPPRSVPAQVPAAATAPARVAEAPTRPQVSYTGGQLRISANDSSLNAILREISQLTGMKITGGVGEERVFGNYGPGDTSSILAALLDGTGSNMLLLFNRDNTPSELVLTRRTGGPTPPNPNAAIYAQRAENPPPQQWIPVQAQFPEQPAGPPPQVPGSAPATPGSNSAGAAQQSPNGVKTPQEIYDQLMRMHQQQVQQQSTPPQ